MRKITFTNVGNAEIHSEYYPKPSKSFLPDWYKNHGSYISDKPKDIIQGKITATVKKCMPVFDVLSAGYMIVTHHDIHIAQNEEGIFFSTPDNVTNINWHTPQQIKNHPMAMNVDGIPKFESPWSIETPKGYSCLFINPTHQRNPYFAIYQWFVDTDNWSVPVNFPFILTDPNFEGIVPAGTPLAQVIPVRRDAWKINYGSQGEKEKVNKTYTHYKTVFYEGYKNFFWSKKKFD